MARPLSNYIFVYNSVGQPGRTAQSLGTKHRQKGFGHHNPNGPRSTRHGQKGAGHHHDLTAQRSTTRTLGQAHGSTTEARRFDWTHKSTGGHSSTAVRVWKVFHGVTKYEVQALGARLEARSEDDGSTVWRGERLPNGAGYSTESTTLVAEQLESFLTKVRDGDQTTRGAQEVPVRASRAAAASANIMVKRPSKARAPRTTQKPATAARPEAPRGEGNALTSTKQGKPKKPKRHATASPTSKASANTKPKSRAPRNTKPKSKAPQNAKPKSKASPNASPKSKASPNASPKSKASPNASPKSTSAASLSKRHSPKAKDSAKRQPAASGPATSRSPVSTHVTPASMRRHLHERHPDTPPDALATLENIWRGGAIEPTRAWMLANNIPDLVDAFLDWVNHHATEAHEYMRAGNATRAA